MSMLSCYEMFSFKEPFQSKKNFELFKHYLIAQTMINV